ncbi:MAG: class I SAM-dependent methyltransferase [Planctomycetota bacterium]
MTERLYSKDIYTRGGYLETHPDWHAEDSPWKARQILKLFERNGLSPKTIVEVGCGAGEILSQLHAQLPGDCTLRGYEISPQAFALCSKRESERLRFEHKDFLAEEGEPVDALLCIDVVEHVEDCFDFLRRLRTKARFKVFHVPLDLSLQSVLRGTPLVAGRSAGGHIHYFTKDVALSLLAESGYRVVDHFYTAGAIEAPGRGALKTLLARPVRRFSFAVHQDLAARVFGGFSLMVLAE